METMGWNSDFRILISGKCGPSHPPYGDQKTVFTAPTEAAALEFKAIGPRLCSLRREANPFDCRTGCDIQSL
jgi:hypothetical protein